MCKVISNKAEIQELVYIFFAGISNDRLKRILNRFSEKRGFGIEFIGFLFSNEIDESFHAYGKLGKNQILFSVDKPVTVEACEAYLNFDEFYNYLDTAIKKVMEDGHEQYNDLEILHLLGEVRAGLGISS